MIVNRAYGYSIVLAAAILISCQKTPDAAQSPNPAGVDGQAAQRAEAEIAPDTVLWVQLQKDLDSAKLKVGDSFSGEIAEEVLVGGKPAIPKGCKVKGRVTNSAVAQAQGSAGLLTLVLDSVDVRGSSYDVTTKPTTLQGVPLQQSLPNNTSSSIALDVKSAYAPKKGILQFFLANAVRIRQ